MAEEEQEISQENKENLPQSDKIIKREIEDEMKRSYLDYSMSVIVGRALPDARDGLKPVHRRILFAMNEMSMFHNKPFKKSARIVGEVLGKYHPHGDSAVYDAMVRMAQSFSLRYPLIDGQGNFGSVDGDSAAAMRYCVTGDTLILTDKGILPIGNISDKKESKINLNVLSYKGRKNKASKFFNSGQHQIVKLNTKLGYKIKGSNNHPILCWTVKNTRPQIEWKLLENINEGDVVLLNRGSSLFSKQDLDLKKFKPKSSQRSKQFKLPSQMNKELAFLLGALVAEGSFHQNKIFFCNSDLDFYDHIKDCIYNQFEGIQLYERNVKGKCLELDLYHQNVVKFLINIGLCNVKSHEKEIPFSVLQSSKQVLSAFLKGLFEGDGSVSHKTDRRHSGKSMELVYNSKSRKLLYQLKTVLLNYGIVTTNIYKEKGRECYKLIISGVNSIKRFNEEIGFFSKRKSEILSKIESMNSSRMSKTDFIPHLSSYLRSKYNSHFISRNNFNRYNNLEKNYQQLIKIVERNDKQLIDFLLKNHFLFDKVAKITKESKEEVFSVKVESSCHSFVANGFINHNTEARLKKFAEELLTDIDKNTVKFVPNFDESLKEPSVLPSKIPNLLINGSSGIAVGMATNIPPHNLKEVCTGIIKLIENPETDVDEIIHFIKGPDFPTSALIQGSAGIREAYRTGRGRVIVKSKYIIEELKKDKKQIVFTEIPYQVNKSMLIEEIARLVKDKKVQGITDLRDESDKKGMRIVVELSAASNSEIILNQLYKHSRLQTTFGINMLALVDGQPRVLSLIQLIKEFIKHRQVVVRRRTEFDLKKAQERAHILEGLIIALNNIDEVVALIKKASTVDEARNSLMSGYSLSKIQAQAILDMRLQRLTSLEQDKIKEEHKSLLELIEKLKTILADENKILQIIKGELQEIAASYSDERRTEISKQESEFIEDQDLIQPEEMAVTISNLGYIKRTPLSSYKIQKRGGKGIKAAGTKQEDFISDIFVANTHDNILFFTDSGNVYIKKVYELPLGSRQAKGTPIVNLLEIKDQSRITSCIPIKEFKEDLFLVMATKKGIIKKTSLNQYSNIRRTGIIAIVLDNDDQLVDVKLTDGSKDILMATQKGMAIRFNEQDCRPIGRVSRGVKGITLRNDNVVNMMICEEPSTVLTVTENGYGKRTPLADYRPIGRGGVGVINIQCDERNGNVVSVRNVEDTDELMFVSRNGITIRMSASDISVIGRNTKGVRIMRLSGSDKVVKAAKIVAENGQSDNG